MLPVVRSFSALLLASLLLAAPVQAQDAVPKIDAFLAAYHETGRFDGTVLVADGGAVIYEQGFGEANRSWGVPHTPDTRFRIASLTKQFTAALVLQLVEAGSLDLDAPVTRYLPDYPAAQGDRVTVHHLLSHTSGIPEHLGLPGFDAMMRNPYAPDSFLTVFSGLPLDVEPGSAFTYSNSNYFLLGVLIEHITGQPYAVALRERLLAPLGLDHTGYDNGTEVIEQMASGYRRVESGFERATYFDPSVPYAAGMMYSTARDLFAWTQALHGGEVFEHTETLEQMTTPVLGEYAYGLGVSMLPVGASTVQVIGHSGGIFGFSTFLLHAPGDTRTVVVLANSNVNTQPIAFDLLRLLYDQPVDLPAQPISAVLEGVIETQGVDAAIARYREIQAGGAEGYDMGEDQLNALGYLYLGRGDVDTALSLFALNVERYPDSWNPYDSLGEAYLIAGNREQAVANYQQALALNPASESAREALERLGADTDEATVRVSLDVLERYVGRYAIRPGLDVAITLEEGRLYAEATGQPTFELVPVSETRFYLPRVEAYVTFDAEHGGPATGLTVEGGALDMRGERIE